MSKANKHLIWIIRRVWDGLVAVGWGFAALFMPSLFEGDEIGIRVGRLEGSEE